MDLSGPERCSTNMKATLAMLVVLLAVAAPGWAEADGLPVAGVDIGDVGVGDGNIRYLAFAADPDTLVQRMEPATGRVLGSVLLDGRFSIPVVAYDSSASGLSADGETLVLISPRPRFPRAKTTFAVLAARSLELRRRITLRGDYSFDAISPDGRWMYLIHYTSAKDSLRYEVVSFDLRRGRLAPEPIVDPREPDEKMNGRPLTRATSSDGRWAYTLYDGTEHPFVHALDTSERDARCIDLDWLAGHEALGKLRFALRSKGRELALGAPPGKPVAVVDTKTFEASRPSSAGVGSWSKAGLASLALILVLGGLVYVVRARFRSPLP
jgi:hypothetical protein